MKLMAVKLSIETRDRLQALGGRTYEHTIIEALDALEADRFWRSAAAAEAWRRSLPEERREAMKRRDAEVDVAFGGIG